MTEGEGARPTLADALAKLQEAMRAARGNNADPDVRRSAARLSELCRCQDDELAAFAKRHLPGRDVDGAALRELRDLVLAVSRLIAAQGSSEAHALVRELRALLLPRLASLEPGREPPKTPRKFGDVEHDLDLFAALSALLELDPDGRDEALALCGLDDEGYAAIAASWHARAESDVDVRAQLLARSAEHRTVVRGLLAGARPIIAL